MTIYKQLKAERQSQQRWEKELCERERRLKQQEESFGRLARLEEMLHTRILAIEEKHLHELTQLQDLLRQRSKENRRLKSSFDTIKELNDNMKKQLNEISEQNKKLESHSKRVQARLENLQVTTHLWLSLLASLMLAPCLAHVLFFTLTFDEDNSRHIIPIFDSYVTKITDCGQSCIFCNNKIMCACVFVYFAQHVALSATLRRIGEEASKPAAQSTVLQSADPDLPKSCSETAGPIRNLPLYQSPCPDTRILSILIILRTVTQADVLAQVLESLHTELMSEESRGLFIHYGGVCVLLTVLRASRGGLRTPIDILMQLTEQSCYLNPFLEVCSCEDFFQTVSQLLKHPRLELPSLEKLSILLQKLSSIRKNRRLFELSSLHLQIQELYHKTNHTHSFLCLNLRSILHNLK
uniref:Coiled-coil domain containing 138 n=1 Tax=Lates calcarifer TaxID=8187 RepID=A0A4W6FDZ7_LATCA